MRPDRTELDPRALGIAAGMVAAALGAFCALSIALIPTTMPTPLGAPMHTGMRGTPHMMMWGGLVGGWLVMSVVVGAACAVTAAIYNRLLRAAGPCARSGLPAQPSGAGARARDG